MRQSFVDENDDDEVLAPCKFDSSASLQFSCCTCRFARCDDLSSLLCLLFWPRLWFKLTFISFKPTFCACACACACTCSCSFVWSRCSRCCASMSSANCLCLLVILFAELLDWRLLNFRHLSPQRVPRVVDARVGSLRVKRGACGFSFSAAACCWSNWFSIISCSTNSRFYVVFPFVEWVWFNL